MTHYYKATILYDGTGYFGFQWQKGIPSVQNDFNLAVGKILKGKFTTMSASRTDTGVHALKQVVKITADNEIDCPSFLEEFNNHLPPRIRCLEIIPSHRKFRPANDHHSKEYHYYFTNKKIVPIEDKRYVSNISKPLDMEAINKCVKELSGTHDFKNFCSAGSNVKSTVRTISTCELVEINPHSILSPGEFFILPKDLTHCYQLRLVGNGFLKQMIRHIVSGLWMVGTGKLSTQDFFDLLYGEKRDKRIWKVAPPNGLFLIDIRY